MPLISRVGYWRRLERIMLWQYPENTDGLLHDPPSGDFSPSHEDAGMTKESRHAANIRSTVQHSHVMIGNGPWLSCRKGSAAMKPSR